MDSSAALSSPVSSWPTSSRSLAHMSRATLTYSDMIKPTFFNSEPGGEGMIASEAGKHGEEGAADEADKLRDGVRVVDSRLGNRG